MAGMCKVGERIYYNQKIFERVSKKHIESVLIDYDLFSKPKKSLTVYALPCNANLNSIWIEFFKGDFTSVVDFNKWLNEVAYYNCNAEMGNYLHYYLEV